MEVIRNASAFSCLLAYASLSSSKVLSVAVTQSDFLCFHFVILVIQCHNLQLVDIILRHFFPSCHPELQMERDSFTEYWLTLGICQL